MTQGVLLVNKLTSRRRILLSGAPPVSGPGACNITLGDVTHGYVKSAGQGTNDNDAPVPPTAVLRSLFQKGDFSWQIDFTSVVAVDAWTSVTIVGLTTVVILSANNTSYLADNFGLSVWNLPVTADNWFGLSGGAVVTAVFA